MSSMRRLRFSTLSSPCLAVLFPMPMTMRSKRLRAVSTSAAWPRVKGSKDPGKIAVRSIFRKYTQQYGKRNARRPFFREVRASGARGRAACGAAWGSCMELQPRKEAPGCRFPGMSPGRPGQCGAACGAGAASSLRRGRGGTAGDPGLRLPWQDGGVGLGLGVRAAVPQRSMRTCSV